MWHLYHWFHWKHICGEHKTANGPHPLLHHEDSGAWHVELDMGQFHCLLPKSWGDRTWHAQHPAAMTIAKSCPVGQCKKACTFDGCWHCRLTQGCWHASVRDGYASVYRMANEGNLLQWQKRGLKCNKWWRGWVDSGLLAYTKTIGQATGRPTYITMKNTTSSQPISDTLILYAIAQSNQTRTTLIHIPTRVIVHEWWDVQCSPPGHDNYFWCKQTKIPQVKLQFSKDKSCIKITCIVL